ncbi:MAG: AraC family transcriptional regulator [Lachnospiraceae bacterium]|nr:AraC family transcriptional regulator [Lachnospiraceae bacterium]
MRYLSEREQKVHGTPEFPIAYYPVTKEHVRYEMPFHWHIECELICVSQGSFRLTVDSAAFLLSAGDSAFIPSGAVHSGIPEDCAYQCIVFDYDQLFEGSRTCQSLYRKWQFLTSHQPRQFLAGSGEALLVSRMSQVLQMSETGYEFSIAGMLWELMGLLIRDNKTSPQETALDHRRREALKKVLWRIRTDCDKQLSLNDLAQEAGLAPRYFCRIFRELTGRTPMDYLNYYRIERAAELLYSTDDTIINIAFSCGFHDAAYFSRIFRHYKQMSPREYRQTHQEDPVSPA